MAERRTKEPKAPRKYYPHPRFPREIDASDVPDTYASRARGDCLEPMIHDGDCLVFSTTQKPEVGDYVGLWFDPEIVPDGESPRQIKCLAMGLMPGLVLPWIAHPDSEVEPTICVEMFNPPRKAPIPASKIVAMHKVIGMGELEGDGRARMIPLETCIPSLPVFRDLPPDMITHLVGNCQNEPILRREELAVVNPNEREPVNDGLFLVQWSNGPAEIVQVWEWTHGHEELAERCWMAGPYRRPRSNEQAEEWMRRTQFIDWLSDGPYPTASLVEKVIGRVIGVLRKVGGAE